LKIIVEAVIFFEARDWAFLWIFEKNQKMHAIVHFQRNALPLSNFELAKPTNSSGFVNL